MEKRVKKEISTEIIYKMSKSKETYNRTYNKINSAGVAKSQRSSVIKTNKNEEKKSNINKRLVKRNINKSSVPKLYPKKGVESNNNILKICLMNNIKKKKLSYTHESKYKYINKILYKIYLILIQKKKRNMNLYKKMNKRMYQMLLKIKLIIF